MSIVTGIAQIAISVTDLGRAAAFYRDALGLKHLFDVPGMSFFDAGGVRLMLGVEGGEPGARGTLVYFGVADLDAAHAELQRRGVHVEQPPHVVSRSAGREVSLAFVTDPDGNLLGLLGERAL